MLKAFLWAVSAALSCAALPAQDVTLIIKLNGVVTEAKLDGATVTSDTDGRTVIKLPSLTMPEFRNGLYPIKTNGAVTAVEVDRTVIPIILNGKPAGPTCSNSTTFYVSTTSIYACSAGQWMEFRAVKPE